jgi:hypothetical protein
MDNDEWVITKEPTVKLDGACGDKNRVVGWWGEGEQCRLGGALSLE